MSLDSRPPRIAVLAVHGVGDQVPGESARAIAAVLDRMIAEAATAASLHPSLSPQPKD